MTTSILVLPDGTSKEFPPPADPERGYTLEELRGAMDGGYIEIVNLSLEVVMVVDEEGLNKGLPFNRMASGFYYMAFGVGGGIVGPALLCESRLIR